VAGGRLFSQLFRQQHPQHRIASAATADGPFTQPAGRSPFSPDCL